MGGLAKHGPGGNQWITHQPAAPPTKKTSPHSRDHPTLYPSMASSPLHLEFLHLGWSGLFQDSDSVPA